MVLYTMVSSIRSPSQHMHIVFTSERLVLLKPACTIYYATWNQRAQRLDYVSQASILQLGLWSRSLVYSTPMQKNPCLYTDGLSVLRGMASGSYRLFCSPVL